MQGQGALMQIKPAHHRQPAQLRDHIGAGRQRHHRSVRYGINLLALLRPHAQWPAAVIHHECQFRQGARHRQNLSHLWVTGPDIQRETQRLQAPGSLAEGRRQDGLAA